MMDLPWWVSCRLQGRVVGGFSWNQGRRWCSRGPGRPTREMWLSDTPAETHQPLHISMGNREWLSQPCTMLDVTEDATPKHSPFDYTQDCKIITKISSFHANLNRWLWLAVGGNSALHWHLGLHSPIIITRLYYACTWLSCLKNSSITSR